MGKGEDVCGSRVGLLVGRIIRLFSIQRRIRRLKLQGDWRYIKSKRENSSGASVPAGGVVYCSIHLQEKEMGPMDM